jgi:hypothetical protein
MRFADAARTLAMATRKEEESSPTELSMVAHQMCLATIMCSIAFLEATVNELYVDCVDRPQQGVQVGLSSEVTKAIAELWKFMKRRPVLDKYHAALRFGKGIEVDRGAVEWGNVAALIELRNAVIHAIPDDFVISSSHPEVPATETALSQRLKSKFAKSPWFAANGSKSDFLSMYVGSPCAVWATNTSITFATAFFDRLGATPRFRKQLVD